MIHPEIALAKLALRQSQTRKRQAELEPIPNVTLSAGYTRQNQNDSNDWAIGVGFPVPLWDRNQGTIQARRAEVANAILEVKRVENDLTKRLVTMFSSYQVAKIQYGRIQSLIIPKAEESLRLSTRAYQGGEFGYLRVLEAQRALAEVKLLYVQALSELWRSGNELACMMLEENWPQNEAVPNRLR